MTDEYIEFAGEVARLLPFECLSGEVLLRLATPEVRMTKGERIGFATRALGAALRGSYDDIPEEWMEGLRSLEKMAELVS